MKLPSKAMSVCIATTRNCPGDNFSELVVYTGGELPTFMKIIKSTVAGDGPWQRVATPEEVDKAVDVLKKDFERYANQVSELAKNPARSIDQGSILSREQARLTYINFMEAVHLFRNKQKENMKSS